jgi:hypothetical protein
MPGAKRVENDQQEGERRWSELERMLPLYDVRESCLERLAGNDSRTRSARIPLHEATPPPSQCLMRDLRHQPALL